MRIDFVFLADSAAQRPDGRIDAIAIGPFAVTAPRFPATVERFAVVVRAGFEPVETHDGVVRIRIVAPSGAQVAEREVTITPPDPLTRLKPEGRVRTRVVNFYTIPVPEPGTYRIHAATDGMAYIGAHFAAVFDTDARGASDPSVTAAAGEGT